MPDADVKPPTARMSSLEVAYLLAAIDSTRLGERTEEPEVKSLIARELLTAEGKLTELGRMLAEDVLQTAQRMAGSYATIRDGNGE